LPNKTRNTYDRVIEQLKVLIPSAAPSVILTDFESSAMSAFQESYTSARVTGCYFHLCQAVIQKVQQLGMKAEYETNDVVRGMVRCLPALSHVPEDVVEEAFDLLVEGMPIHQHMNELISYFEHTYIRGRQLRGRNTVGPALFPIPSWNQHQSAGDGIARTTNIVEGWHHGLQSLFMCSHPTLCTFIEGLNKYAKKQKCSFLQGTAGVVEVPNARYVALMEKVQRACQNFGQTEILTFLRAIAHLSHT